MEAVSTCGNTLSHPKSAPPPPLPPPSPPPEPASRPVANNERSFQAPAAGCSATSTSKRETAGATVQPELEFGTSGAEDGGGVLSTAARRCGHSSRRRGRERTAAGRARRGVPSCSLGAGEGATASSVAGAARGCGIAESGVAPRQGRFVEQVASAGRRGGVGTRRVETQKRDSPLAFAAAFFPGAISQPGS